MKEKKPIEESVENLEKASGGRFASYKANI